MPGCPDKWQHLITRFSFTIFFQEDGSCENATKETTPVPDLPKRPSVVGNGLMAAGPSSRVHIGRGRPIEAD